MESLRQRSQNWDLETDMIIWMDRKGIGVWCLIRWMSPGTRKSWEKDG